VPARFKDGYGPVGAWFLFFKAKATNSLGEDYCADAEALAEAKAKYGKYVDALGTAIRNHLIASGTEPEHHRYWRPQILAFSEDPQRRARLLHFSSWLEGGSGLTTAVRILEGEGIKMRKLKADAEAELERDISAIGVDALLLVVVAPDIQVGIQTLVQAYGVGSLKANTILLNWIGEAPKKIIGLHSPQLGRNLRSAYLQGANIVVLDAKPDKWDALDKIPAAVRTIDVWWWGDATSRLMLLLAYLVTRDKKWSDAKIRLLAVDTDDKSHLTLESLEIMLEDARIEAEPEIIENPDADTITEYSADASLVFLPFRIQANQVVDPFGGALQNLLFLLPVVALVLAAEDIDLDAEPEEGKAGEMAAAADELEEAQKKAKHAAREAAKAADSAETAKKQLQNLPEDAGDELMKKMEKQVLQAEKLAATAARKAAKAEAKVQIASEEAEAKGVPMENVQKDPSESTSQDT